MGVVVVVQLGSWKKTLRVQVHPSLSEIVIRDERFTIQAECWLKSRDVVKRLARLSVERDQKLEAFELNPRIVD